MACLYAKSVITKIIYCNIEPWVYLLFEFMMLPDGIFESDGVFGVSGVSSEESAGEPTGELAGVAAEVVGPFPAAHTIKHSTILF